MRRSLLLTGLTLSAALLIPAGAAASWSTIVQGWTTDTTTMGTQNDIRGVAYNEATGNVLISEDDDNKIVVLDASTGAVIKTITNAQTGDGTVDPFKVRTSNDGYIYVQGFAGTVKLLGTEAINDGVVSGTVLFQAPNSAGTASRSLAVQGSHSAGSAAVYVGRGTDVYVYTNSPGDINTYTLSTTISTGMTNESESIIVSEDKSVVYVHNAAVETKRWTGNPTEYTPDPGFTTPAGVGSRYSGSLDSGDNILVMNSTHNNTTLPYMVTRVFNLNTNSAVGAGVTATNAIAALNVAGNYNNNGVISSNLAGDAAVDEVNDRIFSGATDTVIQWRGVPAVGDVVINEVLYDPGTVAADTGEFVELYNKSNFNVDISGWIVRLVNGAAGSGAAYSTITIPASTTLAAGDYYVIGNATTIHASYPGVVDYDVNLNNVIQNGSPDAVVLYDSSNVRQDSLNYRGDAAFGTSVGSFTADAVAEGGFGRTFGPYAFGNTRLVSAGRFPNGRDTNVNSVDFANIPLSPGSANASQVSLPFTDNFTGGFNPAWRGAFVENRVVDGNTALGVASAQGGDVLEVVDTTGGGDTAYLPMAETTVNLTGEIYIPADTTDGNGWSIGVGVAERANVNWFSDFTANGMENGFYLEYQNSTGLSRKAGQIPAVSTAGTARLIAVSSVATANTGAVTAATAVVLGSTTTVNKGAFNTFRVYHDSVGNRLYAEINGNVIYNGVIPAGTYNTSGGVVVGFHEEHTGNPVTTTPREGAYVDAITINTTAPPANAAPTDIALSNSTVAENNTPPTTVGALSATDESFDTAVFTIVAGAGDGDNGSFSISGSDLVLTVAADFETKSTYNVRVRVTDQANNTYEEALVVSISDVVESSVSDWTVLHND